MVVAGNGWEYRLLSESEWEYVARGGTTGPFHYGSTITPEQANYDGNYTYGGGGRGRYRERTVSVGSFSSNDFGLHDVHGNVWEWVEDCWHDSYRGAPTDGSAWTSGRVVEIAASVCCVAARGSADRVPCAPRIASGTPPAAGTAMSVFAYPGRWIESCLFASSPLVGGPGCGAPWRIFGTGALLPASRKGTRSEGRSAPAPHAVDRVPVARAP